MEWRVNCPTCGEFIQIQKTDPVLCPQCQNPDIDTENVEEPRTLAQRNQS